jgi:hypothetical protein
MRPYVIPVEEGEIMVPPVEHCVSPADDARQLVVASCAENLTWTRMFARRGWDVVVLEQCPQGRMMPSSGGNSWGVGQRPGHLWLPVRPNVGREAHAYLFFLTHHWDRLRPITLFLQGDAPKHVNLAEALQPGGALDRFATECWSFMSLVAAVHPSTFKVPSIVPLRTFCTLWRSFDPTPPAEAPCPVWSAVGFASFAVARRTIMRHPRHVYARWLRSFERPSEAKSLWGSSEGEHAFHPTGWHVDEDTHRSPQLAQDARVGATFFERAWALIFGCSEALGACTSFLPQEHPRALARRCPLTQLWGPNGGSVRNRSILTDGPRHSVVRALVRRENHSHACRAVYRLAERPRGETASSSRGTTGTRNPRR